MVLVVRKVLNIVQNNPEGISFKELVTKAGFSDKTVRNAAIRLHNDKQIDYPPPELFEKRRGRKILIRPIFDKKLVFRKFKSPRKFKKEVSNYTPIIFEWIDREVEDFEDDPIVLSATEYWKIDFRKKTLRVLGLWFFEGDKGWNEINSGDVEFSLKDVTAIHAPTGISDFDEMLELWENPTLRFEKGIICNWDGGITSHSKECNSSLHETMSRLRDRAQSTWRDEKEKRKAKNDIKKIVQFIIDHGGKIPFTGL